MRGNSVGGRAAGWHPPSVLISTYPLRRPQEGPADLAFLREQERRGHRHAALRSLRRHVTEDVLGDAAILSTYDCDAMTEVVAEAGDTLVMLRVWPTSAEVYVSATERADAARVAAEIAARVDRLGGDRSVEVTFSDGTAGDRTLAVSVRPWPEIAPLYPAAVRDALAGLLAYVPDDDEARRLMLWHGVPGTGKTTALRALLHAWRDWTDAVVVTDPDRLLEDGRYLRRLVLDADDEDRWRLVVVEDAESLVNQSNARTIGKMLNLADGLLGQGLRCLFLLTANTPLTGMHPAVTRPGRCLARVEFTELSASEAARVLGRPVDRPRTLAEVLAARTVTNAAEPVAVGQYL